MRQLILFLKAFVLAAASHGVSAQVSSGTAFSIAPQLLITNQHVIAGCTSIEVITADGRRSGAVADADARLDLALLRVSGLKGTTARLRNPRDVRLGETVMVFGFPLAGSLSSGGNFTSGLVSALRGLRDAAGELQITAPVQPGNSGGPLLDASGLVIGVVQAKLDALRSARTTGDIPQNVNFAISLDVLADFLTKNKVPFRDGARSSALDTARVAELAQNFTYRVECRGRSQQARAPTGIEPRRLPQCPGPYKTAPWTNCFGEFDFANGQKYVGEWRNDDLEGQGTLTYPGGSKYVGEFRNGKRNGQGTHTHLSGAKYVGEFRDNERNGQGTQTFPSGSKYVGEFRNDEFNGQGTMTYPSGWKYIGEFRDGNEHGQGIEYRADGSVIRSGNWENGKFIRGR